MIARRDGRARPNHAAPGAGRRQRRSPIAGVIATAAIACVAAASCAAPQPNPVHIRRTTPRLDQSPDPYSTSRSISSGYAGWTSTPIDRRLADIGPIARLRWKPDFARAGVSYPPASVEILVLKRERIVEIYAGSSPHSLSFVRTMPIEAASGGPGPKLREGDRQVPEGFYAVEKLNPHSKYHVSLRLSYPNAFDVRMGTRDRRRRLGGDIMIHGGAKSIGCVAVGDLAAEDLFVLSADAGLANVSVTIAPRDFRRTSDTEPMPGQPPWVRDLYGELDRRLRVLPAPAPLAAGTSRAATAN
jgi:hypothetical protein